MSSRLYAFFAALLAASASANASQLASAAVPTTCTSFSVTGGGTETCAVTLTEGSTYQLYTPCGTAKGAPVLRLLDEAGTEVAYNDGYPFCGANERYVLLFCVPHWRRQHGDVLTRD